ncbi:MAG: hypothetical protein PVI97_16650 [Candidatus Thiodiazotropha sp.]|jgi:hypothetical protein
MAGLLRGGKVVFQLKNGFILPILETPHIDPTVASFDMQMLIGTRGRERTEGEWRALFEQNGYALRETVSLRTFARLLVIDIE